MSNKPQKVLMAVCNYFTNDNRVFRAADALSEKGFDVQLLAYHRTDLKEKETMGHGFHLNRLPLNTWIKKPSQFSNFLKYLKFRRKSKAFANQYEPDTVHCHDYNTLFLGVYCQKKFGAKIVYDNHEYFQDLKYLHRYPKVVRRYIAHYEKETIRYWVDEMIVVSEGIADAYNKITGTIPTIVMNITDWRTIKNEKPSEIEFKKYDRYLSELKQEGKELLLYMGQNFVRGRGMNFSIELLKNLPEHYFLIIFGCSNNKEVLQIRKIFITMNMDHRIKVFKFASLSDLYHLRSYFSYGLSMIEPIYFSYNFSLPNKLFEYIMMGLPVIASEIPEQKQIVEKYNVGFIANLETPELTAKLILKMKRNIFRGMEKARKALSWENEKEKLLRLYQEN